MQDERTTLDAETLDRIDVRYSVSTHFEFGSRDFFVAKADFQITCGVCSGVPTRSNMAELVMERGVYDHDISDLTGTHLSKEVVARMIMERGVTEHDIRRMTIEEVTLDDQPIAVSID
jgi:hypothetical protein